MSFLTLLRHEITVLARRRLHWLHPPFFLLMTVSLFSIALGDLPAAAPAVLWSSVLLCAMLSQDGIFLSDWEDGSLEQMLLCPRPLTLLLIGKTFAHWTVSGFPAVLLSPLLALWLQLPFQPIVPLTLFLGTWVFSLLATFGAALSLGQKSGLLTVLIVFPLAIPTVLFAIGALQAAMGDLPATAHLSILAALCTFSFTVLPPLSAAALRVMIGQ